MQAPKSKPIRFAFRILDGDANAEKTCGKTLREFHEEAEAQEFLDKEFVDYFNKFFEFCTTNYNQIDKEDKLIRIEPFIYEDFDGTLHELYVEIVELAKPIEFPDFDEIHRMMINQLIRNEQAYFEFLKLKMNGLIKEYAENEQA